MFKSKIKSIEYLGTKETFDLHTPKYNNFFLDNGILSHNSGKSFSALSIASIIDPNFSVEKNVCFDPDKFLDLVQTLPPGSVIIGDEFGTQMDSRSAMNKQNKALSHLFQTMRYKNHIVFLTVPDFGMVDKNARKLTHAVLRFNAKSVDKRNGLCWGDFSFLENDERIGEIFFKRMRVHVNGKYVCIERVPIPKPIRLIVDKYEKMKRKYFEEYYEKLSANNASVNVEEKKEDIVTATDRLVSMIKQDLIVNPRTTIKDLSVKYNLSMPIARKRFSKAKEEMTGEEVQVNTIFID